MSGFEDHFERSRRVDPECYDYGTRYGDSYACRRCGADVKESHIEVHDRWHVWLDQLSRIARAGLDINA